MQYLIYSNLIALTAVSHSGADAIDDLLKMVMKEQQVPGITLAILKDGKPVKIKAYGVAEVENQVPARVDTVYELASLSKQFTATALLELVDEGKVSLDDPVSKFIEDAPESWSGMKVRHLLNHTAGLVEFHFRPDRVNALSFMRYTTAMQIEDIKRSKLLFAPGSKYAYSNAGYLLLGVIIEKVSGIPYRQFMQDRIFKPVGMDHTGLSESGEIVAKRACGYTVRKGKLVQWTLSKTLQSLDLDSFGAMYSTVPDLIKWENALAAKKLLKSETWNVAWNQTSVGNGKWLNYGYGWGINPTSKHGYQLRHTGHSGTIMVRLPQKKMAVILLSNHGIGNPPPYGNDTGWDLSETTDKVIDLAVAKYAKDKN